MIYMHILPPKEKHAETGRNLRVTEVYHTTEGMRDYDPINRYDEFVSSHASCCEHTTNYFGHYHRHLLILYEMSLNEADQSLRKREIPEGFQSSEYQKLFENVFQRYEEIIKGCKEELNEGETLPYVALHYWNPMDYRSRIKFPEYFSERNKQEKAESDPFWILHRRFLKCDFGEKNFKHTWNSGEDFRPTSIFLTAQNTQSTYTYQERQILNGDYRRNGELTFSLPLLKRKIPRNKFTDSFRSIYETGKTRLVQLSEE